MNDEKRDVYYECLGIVNYLQENVRECEIEDKIEKMYDVEELLDYLMACVAEDTELFDEVDMISRMIEFDGNSENEIDAVIDKVVADVHMRLCEVGSRVVD